MMTMSATWKLVNIKQYDILIYYLCLPIVYRVVTNVDFQLSFCPQ